MKKWIEDGWRVVACTTDKDNMVLVVYEKEDE